MKKIIKLVVDKQCSGERLDTFISSKITDISRTRIKNLILNGTVKINNQICYEPSKKINLKNNLIIEIPPPKETNIKPYNYNLDIIFEDNNIIIVNKPAGLVVHPGAGNTENTLVNALVYYCKGRLSTVGGKLRPGIVHRLDKDTSGLLVVAKNDIAHINLSKQFNDHTINRKYEALVWGTLRPQKGIIKSYITRSNRNRQLMEASCIKGKFAVTNYKTLEVFQNNKIPTLSLIECKLDTGRTHQIRVHTSYKGNPIVGDKLYQKKNKKFKRIDIELNSMIKNINRQFLHAKSLGFIHPLNNEKVRFEVPLPKDLSKLVKKLRNLSK
jgi:23S rRNA pseudouridine1911/1915/1917 synthase|tara:strand:+ start:159 stop:1139 length:981 start_codon:yes stop_codon:yes gene_type:complete